MSVLLLNKIKGNFYFNKIKGKNVSFLNPYSYVKIRSCKRIIDGIDVFFMDGFILTWFFNIFFIKRYKRLSFDMTSLADSVFEICEKENLSIYFIGSKQPDIEKFKAKITNKYPSLRILGSRNGYFDSETLKSNVILDLINIPQPEIIVIGTGVLNQEMFSIQLRDAGFNGTIFTCGGFIHQTANSDRGLNYYPTLINAFNLRWLYRIYDEPKLIIRYLIDYPKFIFYFSFDVIFYYINLFLNKFRN